jgi:DNA-binding NtrC family response regulator
MLWLLGQAWPRNVRELDKTTAEVATGLVEEGIVRLPFLPIAGAATSSAGHRSSTPGPTLPPGSGAGSAFAVGAAETPPRARPQRAEMERLLEVHAFNQTEVARVLGVPYATLDRWLRELAVVRPRDLSAADIQGALQRCTGDVAQTATLLRVSIRGLKARMHELGFSTS